MVGFRKIGWLWFASAVAVAAGLAGGARAQAPSAFVQLRKIVRKMAGGREIQQQIQCDNDLVSFGMAYDITLSKDLPPGHCGSPQWVFQIGFVPLGMSHPAACNWYTQGFFTVRLDGENLYDRPLDWRVVRAGGSDALVEGRWSTEKGPVLVRLLLRGGDDKLLLQALLPPENKGKKLELELLAYPQGFSKPWKRCMFTARRTVTGPAANVSLDPKTEPWAVFYDAGMAGTARAAGGPCGLVYVPSEATVRVALGPYSVRPVLTTRPGRRRITVGLWDFSADPDLAACRAYLRNSGAAAAAALAAIAGRDWAAAALPAATPSKYLAARLKKLLKLRSRPTAYDSMTSAVRSRAAAFGRPLAGGPLSALIIAPRWGQRETVELGERLDLRADTVSFSSPDSILLGRWLYLYGSYTLYGYPRKSLGSVLSELRAKLARPHDVIVLSNIQAGIIPGTVRREILDRVRRGAGLLLIGANAERLLRDVSAGLKPRQWTPGAFPAADLPVFRDKLKPRQSLWTAYALGKGRILVFHYSLGGNYGRHCLTPRLGWDAPDARALYDLYHLFVADGMLWTAHRELPAPLGFLDHPPRLVVHSRTRLDRAHFTCWIFTPSAADFDKYEWTQKLAGRAVRIPLARSCLGPGAGPRYLLVNVRRAGPNGTGPVLGWGAARITAPAPAWRIQTLKLDRTTGLRRSDRLRVQVRLNRPLPAPGRAAVRVVDAWGRTLFQGRVPPGAAAADFAVPLDCAITPWHRLVCEVRSPEGAVLLDRRAAEFTVRIPIDLEDMHFLVWTDGANDPMAHLIMDQLAARGVDWIDNTGLTQARGPEVRLWCRNAAEHHLRSVPYITRISCSAPRGRVRRPCLTDPAYIGPWLRDLRERARAAAPYGPAAYTLGDENFLVRARHDVCTSPTCLAAFHAFLQEEYGDIARLNAEWKSAYRAFAAVTPASFSEVKDRPELWPRWADHRRFMDGVFTRAHLEAREAIRAADPGARVGWDGVFSLDSWHGYDFYALCRGCDMNEVYASHLNQIEFVRCWHQRDSVRGAWYNTIGNRSETAAKALGWHLLFHQFNSMWYWMAYNTGPALLFPDMRPTPQFQWLAENFRELRGGIAKALLSARRLDDGIGVYYSQASVHAGTLLGRQFAQAQWGFMRWIEDNGLQYRLLAGRQAVKHGIPGDIRLLFLPLCAALGPGECAALRRFVERGGVLVADSAPGLLDQHCGLSDSPRLDALFGVRRHGLPKPGPAAMTLTGGGLEGSCPLPVADSRLATAGAEAWARGGKTPCVLVHTAGKGRTVLLNTRAEQFLEIHSNGRSAQVRPLMQRILALAGIAPRVRVVREKDGTPLPACEIVRFQAGGILYVCLLRDPAVTGTRPEPVVIELPAKTEVVDVRAGKRLGRMARVRTELAPGDPKILALLPGLPAGLQVVCSAGGRVFTGRGPVRFELRLTGMHGALAGPHVIHVDVLASRAGGKSAILPEYSRNLRIRAAAAAFTLPLVPGDRGRTLRVRVRDVSCGLTAVSAPFHVQ